MVKLTNRSSHAKLDQSVRWVFQFLLLRMLNKFVIWYCRQYFFAWYFDSNKFCLHSEKHFKMTDRYTSFYIIQVGSSHVNYKKHVNKRNNSKYNNNVHCVWKIMGLKTRNKLFLVYSVTCLNWPVFVFDETCLNQPAFVFGLYR